MLCPIDSYSGLITLTGGISPVHLKNITTNAMALPMEKLTFPVRRTPPTRSGTFLQEVNPEQNLCSVKGNKGELNQIQICKETHVGYQLPGNNQKPVAELILSFRVTTRAAGSAVYDGILLCLPIYAAIPSQQDHHEYLAAVLNGSMTADAATLPSLSSLFYSSEKDTSQVSLSYKTCVEIQTAKGVSTRRLAVYVFPRGIHIASNVLEPFLASYPLQRFQLPSAIRDGNATASKYRFTNEGEKEITETSSEGFLYTTPVNSCHEEFTLKFQYFARPPPIPSVSPSSSITKKALTTSQYKCVPFDKLANVSANDTVHMSPTLKSVLETQEKFKQFQEGTHATGLSSEQMEGIIAGAILSVGAIIGIGYAVYYRTST